MGLLDYGWYEFDLIVTGSPWEVNGKTGIKAYLQTLFAVLQMDDLERKYGIVASKAHAAPAHDRLPPPEEEVSE